MFEGKATGSIGQSKAEDNSKYFNSLKCNNLVNDLEQVCSWLAWHGVSVIGVLVVF